MTCLCSNTLQRHDICKWQRTYKPTLYIASAITTAKAMTTVRSSDGRRNGVVPNLHTMTLDGFVAYLHLRRLCGKRRAYIWGQHESTAASPRQPVSPQTPTGRQCADFLLSRYVRRIFPIRIEKIYVRVRFWQDYPQLIKAGSLCHATKLTILLGVS